MDNTNENETPLFGKKPNAEEPVAAPVVATPETKPEAAPAASVATPIAAPTAKKTSVGLIIGAIITGAALIAAAIVLVIVLINRQPSTSSSDKKSDETSETENKEKKPEKDEDEDEDKKDDDKDEDQKDDDKDEDSDDKDEDENEDEDEDEDDNTSTNNGSDAKSGSYTLGINGKTFKFSNNYVETVKNAVNAGYDMTYQDINYKDQELSKSNLNSYLNSELKYGTEVAIIDANGDDILTIEGIKGSSTKVSDAKFDDIYYAATMQLTLPDGNKVSCYNTTKDEIFNLYGKAEISTLGIVHYTKDGIYYSFHLDDKGTLEAVFLRIDK